jgi:hypothetical protein
MAARSLLRTARSNDRGAARQLFIRQRRKRPWPIVQSGIRAVGSSSNSIDPRIASGSDAGHALTLSICEWP